ncbi:MAG: DUF1513 domain-containing protein [Hyphomicrobiaceae bacterium]
MSQLTRRDVAWQCLTIGLVAAMGDTAAGAPEPSTGVYNQASLRGHVHALGLNPKLYSTYDRRQGEGFSVLTSLDLASGAVRQNLIGMAGGHMTCSLPNGRILCIAHHKPKSLIVNNEHQVLAELTTDTEHVFGGHGLVDRERNIILIPQRRKLARGPADVGSLLIFDAGTFRLLDQVESGGIHPHELHKIPGTNELAVTHYGDIGDVHPVFEHNVVDPKLTILDGQTLKPKRHYLQHDLKAMVTHMSVDNAGWAHLVLTQYIAWPVKEVGNAYNLAVTELERVIGRRVSFDMPQAALEERLLPVPLPMLSVHTQTGERKIINTGDQNHLRSQSVAFCKAAQAAVAVYSHSDNLVVLRKGREPVVVDGKRLGLRNMRGVVELPETTLVAVMGAYRNVVIYDLLKDQVVARYETSNYLDTHLSHGD